MFSICIPVFNYDITNLVNSLSIQAKELAVPYEIIVIDDCSDICFKKRNRIIEGKPDVRYIELQDNIGRATIRNRLVERSVYEYLIFMDCDVCLPDEYYLKRYYDVCFSHKIVFGGRIYQQLPPDPLHYLRWWYGVNRESEKATLRNVNPNRGFKTCNFLISKKIFQNIVFDETITGYGHEDTLMGYMLKKSGLEIFHIDNPTIHLGLETAIEFIAKTGKGLENLLRIYNQLNQSYDFIKDVKVLKYFHAMKKIGLIALISLFFKIFKPVMIRNLSSAIPSLLVFDCYKLGYLCYISKHQKYRGENKL